jgi:hypothetical protein
MIITSHMQNIIQIHPCLLKLSRKQENVTDGQTDRRIFQPKTKIFPQSPCFKYFHVKTHPR